MGGLREAVADELRHVHFDGNGCGTHGVNACSVCFGPSPMVAEEVAEVVETAVLAWFRERLASAEVREAVAGALLVEHMDGDFLVGAGRSIGSEGDDVPINHARPAEVAWWAADAALAAVLAALADGAGS